MKTALMPTESRLEQKPSVTSAWPMVSVVIPVFNEEPFIAQSLRAVLQQDYPADRLEIIVADGASTDRTRDIVISIQNEYGNVRLIYNPARIVSAGLNRALACAQGEIIVRLDGHCEYPADYIRKVVQLRQRMGADNAGGVLVPVGTGYVQRAVGAAYYSPVGIGGAALKGGGKMESVREVDAVHGGCWQRERLREIGGFDEEMVRNQDDELSFRLRKAAGRIFQSSSIQVKYHVRDSYKKLFMQFAQYGYWKVRVVQKHPQQASVRHFIPAIFFMSVLLAALLAPWSGYARYGLGILGGSYLSALGLATVLQAWPAEKKLWPGIMLALMAMHFGYGGGFVLGWLRAWAGPLPSDPIFERTTR